MTGVAPIVLIETGVKAEGFPSDVLITKDESVTHITIPWDEPGSFDEAFIDEALAVLAPLRNEHPRFGATVDRLLALRQQLHEEVNGA